MRATPSVAPPGFWQQVRDSCNQFGALLIFDEIPTGLGKTGKMFSCQHDNVTPDILVLGKALGGGVLPMAAMLTRENLDICHNLASGHYTHVKNPVTATAALATLDIIRDEGLVDNAAGMGELALAGLRELQQRHELIGEVRGRGCLWGVELVLDRVTKEPAYDVAEQVLYASLRRGLSFKVMSGNVLTLTPPLVITEGHIEQALTILDEALAEVEQHQS